MSELHLTLGDVVDAIDAARRSIDAADKDGDGFLREITRAKLADTLHQSGALTKSSRALSGGRGCMPRSSPSTLCFYSLQGYQYCDLLLAQGESAEVLRREA